MRMLQKKMFEESLKARISKKDKAVVLAKGEKPDVSEMV